MSCYFYLFYCLLDMRSGEYDVVSFYVCVALSMHLFVCVFDSVCYFVVECDGVVKCCWRCSIG